MREQPKIPREALVPPKKAADKFHKSPGRSVERNQPSNKNNNPALVPVCLHGAKRHALFRANHKLRQSVSSEEMVPFAPTTEFNETVMSLYADSPIIPRTTISMAVLRVHGNILTESGLILDRDGGKCVWKCGNERFVTRFCV